MELFLASLCAGPLSTYHGGLCCEQLSRNPWCFEERLVKGATGPQGDERLMVANGRNRSSFGGHISVNLLEGGSFISGKHQTFVVS